MRVLLTALVIVGPGSQDTLQSALHLQYVDLSACRHPQSESADSSDVLWAGIISSVPDFEINIRNLTKPQLHRACKNPEK